MPHLGDDELRSIEATRLRLARARRRTRPSMPSPVLVGQQVLQELLDAYDQLQEMKHNAEKQG